VTVRDRGLVAGTLTASGIFVTSFEPSQTLLFGSNLDAMIRLASTPGTGSWEPESRSVLVTLRPSRQVGRVCFSSGDCLESGLELDEVGLRVASGTAPVTDYGRFAVYTLPEVSYRLDDRYFVWVSLDTVVGCGSLGRLR